MGDLGRRRRAVGHRVVVVLAGDLDRAGRRGGAPGGCRRGGRRAACRSSAPRAVASSWWPRQMPKTGTSPSRPPDGVGGVADRGRVARAVGQEHAVGLAGQHLGGRRWTPAPPRRWRCSPRWRRMVALDAEVVGDDPARARRRPCRARCVVTVGDQVDAVGARLGHAPPPSASTSSAVPNAPGMAPASRRWRVSRRVSMPAMPGTPWRRRNASRSRVAAPAAAAGGPGRGR